MEPSLHKEKSNLYFTHLINLPDGDSCQMSDVTFFTGDPSLALIDSEVFLLRNPPPSEVLGSWASKQKAPVSKLTHRLLTNLRKINTNLKIHRETETHKTLKH